MRYLKLSASLDGDLNCCPHHPGRRQLHIRHAGLRLRRQCEVHLQCRRIGRVFACIEQVRFDSVDGNFYRCPAAERGFDKTAKNFATQTIITAGANVLKEFWPAIRKNVFRLKDKSPPTPGAFADLHQQYALDE